MNHYVVAIPSYRRQEILAKQTLTTLERLATDPERVHIFVANDEEQETYAGLITGYKTIVGVKGISEQRAFIHAHFSQGTPIISIDDDISAIMQKDDDKTEPTTYTLDQIAETGFGICDKESARMWGINPVANGFFMKDQITVGLRFICANFMGSYAGDPVYAEPHHSMSSADDHYATLRSHQRYGAVVRIEYLCPKTKYWAKGGIDEALRDEGAVRVERHAKELRRVASLYPSLATPTTRKGVVSSLKLKALTRSRYPRGFVV
jgi:hypothetical protein